jgi:enoyl-CoA hydratase/carnithine racemase
VYDLPDEISVRAEGALRIVTLNRPEALNAVNDSLHTGLALLWPRLSADAGARAAVLTGAGTAFSAGGDFGYLAELRRDQTLRARTLAHGRDIVLGMARCRVPVVAAVNGPAVGLGCSLVALSDVVYLAETAFLADPHVQVGLVAADGGPLTWPLHTSLLLAKEYALTGARIPAERAVAMGLANHVVADPLAEATACAQRIAGLPQQAVESTKRLLNLHLERAVLATLDFAISAEDRTFDSPDLARVLAAHEARKGGAA